MKDEIKKISFNEACKKVYDYFVSLGFLGIDFAGDADDEWVFFMKDYSHNVRGNKPVFFNKNNGSIRVMDYFDPQDLYWAQNSESIEIPLEYSGFRRGKSTTHRLNSK